MTTITLTLPDCVFLGKEATPEEVVLNFESDILAIIPDFTDHFFVLTSEYKQGKPLVDFEGLTIGDIMNLRLKDIGVE